MQLKISTMSGKLKGIPAINTNTLSNPFCQSMSRNNRLICSNCYSVGMLKTFRQNCCKAFQHNSDLLSKDIIKDIPIIKHDTIRINAHGELINYTHSLNLINIINYNPQTSFTLWTKRYNLINKYLSRHSKPKNLILIYSNPIINNVASIYNPKLKYFDKTFNCHTTHDMEQVFYKINCSMSCIDCMLCYRHNKTNIINELIKLKIAGKRPQNRYNTIKI
jgi:hypothetical protein